MEMVFTVCFVLGIALLMLLINVWAWYRKESSFHLYTIDRLPPGDISPWAIWGTTLELFFSWHPAGTCPPFIRKQIRRYGPVFKTRFLGLRTIVSLDPDVNRQIMLSEGNHGMVRSTLPFTLRTIVGPNSLPLLHGPKFKHLRSPVALYLSAAKVNENHELLVRLQKFTLSFLDDWSRRQTIYLQDEAYKFTFSIAIILLLGLEAVDDDYTQSLTDCFQSFIPAATSKFPFNIPGTTYAKALQGRKRASDIIRELIQRRRHEITVSTDDEDKENELLTQMILDIDKETGAPTYTDDELIDVIFGLIMAGRETVSLLLLMAIKYLTDDRQALTELKDEHDRIRDQLSGYEMPSSTKNVSFLKKDDFGKMYFTQKVITETLRLANVSPFVQRVALQDIEIKGFIIPKGWNVFLSPYVTHLNGDNYEDPLRFNPWRWNDSTNLAKSFTPFGVGLRFCVGTHIARLQICMFLHYLVTSYRWEVKDKYEAFCTPLIKMQNGFPIRVIPI